MSTVLVCVDRSSHSDHALEYYLKYIHKEGNIVKVVHCPEMWTGIGPMEGPTPGRLEELRQETEANTAAIQERVIALLQSSGVQGEFVRLSHKDPWHAVVDAAKNADASLIVIGSRGQGTIRRTLLGSVSDSVVHHAHCPVLVCRKPSEK